MGKQLDNMGIDRQICRQIDREIDIYYIDRQRDSMYRQIDSIDRQIDRQIDIQICRQIDRQIYRQVDRQIDGWIYR